MTGEAKKVVDALKSCNNQNDCRNCVYDKTEGDCVENMEYAAIKLIEKQSAEIEGLREQLDEAKLGLVWYSMLDNGLADLIDENEELRNQVYNLTLYLHSAMDMLSTFYFCDIDLENMSLQIQKKYDGMPGYNPEILEVRNE